MESPSEYNGNGYIQFFHTTIDRSKKFVMYHMTKKAPFVCRDYLSTRYWLAETIMIFGIQVKYVMRKSFRNVKNYVR